MSSLPVTWGEPLATWLAVQTYVKWLACLPCKHKVVGSIPTVAKNATMVPWVKQAWVVEFGEIHAHLWLVDMGQWGWCMISSSEWFWHDVFICCGGLSYLPVPWCEPLTTWLEIQTFSQVVKHILIASTRWWVWSPVTRNATIVIKVYKESYM